MPINVNKAVDKQYEGGTGLKELLRLQGSKVFLDVRTGPTENVWAMVQAGKGITEMLLGSEEL